MLGEGVGVGVGEGTVVDEGVGVGDVGVGVGEDVGVGEGGVAVGVGVGLDGGVGEGDGPPTRVPNRSNDSFGSGVKIQSCLLPQLKHVVPKPPPGFRQAAPEPNGTGKS